VKSRSSDQSTNIAGTESTCPQPALSAITAGLKSTAAATSARTGHRSLSEAGARRAAKVPAIQARPRSARIAGSFRSRYPGAAEIFPVSQRTYRYPGG
jgi:hypothetical protein